MGLKQRHRRLLLGLLVLGCVGLTYTTATEGARGRAEEQLKNAVIPVSTCHPVLCQHPLCPRVVSLVKEKGGLSLRLGEFTGKKLV
jgi:hypothetical protein